MLQRLKTRVDYIIDFVLPPRCPINGDIVDKNGMVSAEVWNELEFITEPFCQCCGLPFDYQEKEVDGLCAACLEEKPPFDRARSALVYNDVSRQVILRFKHADQIHLVQSIVPWLYLINN